MRKNLVFTLIAMIMMTVPALSQPASSAPTPTVPVDSVQSIFSDAYTSTDFDSWSSQWDDSSVEDYVITAVDTAKLYIMTNFNIAEYTTGTMDISSMAYFHIDIWTPDTISTEVFKVKLVDYGANGAYDGGGDDTEHELIFSAASTPALASESWISFDIPLNDFSGMTGREHFAQMIISGDLDTIYVDNVFFYTDVVAADPVPTTSAPIPTQDAGSVQSIFSDTYTGMDFDSWSSQWDDSSVENFVITAGDTAKKYLMGTYNIAEYTTSGTMDISSMTTLHMDIWTPDAITTEVFKVKLVDYGANGSWDGGGDDTEHELTFDASSTPALASENWISFDIPIADFTGMTGHQHFAQLIVSGDLGTIYIDNVYFYDDGSVVVPEPTVAAPTPTQDQADVISLFSDVYTDQAVDTWSTGWDVADVADYEVVSGDTAKLYTNFSFSITEFVTQQVDASTMDYFHMDIWTPDATDGGQVFKIKLYDLGPNGVWEGLGVDDDSESELTFSADSIPALTSEQWVSFDIPISAFTGLTNTANLAQLILSGDPNTVYVDNVYFYAGGPTPTEPTVAAPTPTVDAADVISLFSNAYTDVTVDTWSADWPDDADLADVQVAGDDTKLYTNLTYAGIEFTSNPVDASAMTHFHMDIWTPDDVTSGTFKIKLVDFGANGVWGTDDSEYELTFSATTDPALITGTWVGLDIPLTDFVGLTSTGALAQMILSGNADINTVYVDNVYFYDSGTVIEVPEPTVSAPTPTVDAANVQSIFSDAYASSDFDSWDSQYDDSSVEDYLIGTSDNVKKYLVGSFTIAEYTSNTMNISGMTHVHFDIWTPRDVVATDSFKVKLVDYGTNGVWDGGGDDTEHELYFDASTTPALTGESWISFDLPLSEFVNMTGREHFAQFIMATNVGIVYIDNLYFYNDGSSSAPETAVLPSEFELKSIYPNPFNPSTNVEIALPETANIQIVVYNSLGQHVSTMASGVMNAGVHSLTFDGSQLASGLYYVVAKVDGRHFGSQKMMLIK